MSIANPSPNVLVNGFDTTDGVDIGVPDGVNNNYITIDLQDPAGVNVWTIECIGTDENNNKDHVNYNTGFISSTRRQIGAFAIQFAHPGEMQLGSAFIFKSVVNGGIDINGNIVESYTTTFGVYIKTDANLFLNLRVGAVNETTEGDHEFGWVTKVNQMFRSDVRTAGGDLDGYYPDPTVIAIRNIAINSNAPFVGNSLVFYGGPGGGRAGFAQFQPINLGDNTGQTYTGALQMGGGGGGWDVEGTVQTNRVVALQQNPLKVETLGSDEDGYVLTWNNGNNQWEATISATSPVAGGDLDGNYPNPTVVAIQGYPVTNAVPTSGYGLIWNGSAWAPTAIAAVTVWADDLSTSSNTHQYIDQISGANGSGGTVTGKFTTLNFNKSGVTDYYVKGFDNTSAVPGNIHIKGGAFFGTTTSAIGGHAYLQGGDFNGTGTFRKGGDGYVLGGAVQVGSAGGTEGGNVHLLGGDASTVSGGISGNVYIGSPVSDVTGFVEITTGTANTGSTSGSIFLQTGAAPTGTVGSLVFKTNGNNTRLSISGAGVITIPGLAGSGNGFVTVDNSGVVGFTTLTASGDLSGTYPAPTVAKVNGVSYPSGPSTNTVPVVTGSNTITYQQIVNAQVSASAAIAYSKLALTGSIVNADVNASAAIAYSKLALTGSIVNADVNASAAIAVTKLAAGTADFVLTTNGSTNAFAKIVNANIDSAAAIAYSKLALTGSIVNADVNASAAIAYSKLNLSGSIVNADVSTSAAIAVTKLAAGTAGQVLMNNSTPAPHWTDITGDITLSTSGVVEVTDIRGNAVKSQSLGAGQDGNILTWVDANSQWEAQPNLAAVTFAGDLSGTVSSQTVIRIQGNPVNNTALGPTQDGYVLTWDNGVGEIKAKPNSGGPPTGTAGGNLSGSYPNPTVAKINGVSVNATPSADTVLVASSGTASTWAKIVNANVDASAAIAYSKLNLSGSIVNADVNASAAIVYTKLNLTGSIVNADIATGAVIDVAKLATGSAGQILLNNSSPLPTWTTVSGDTSISSSGATTVLKINGNAVSSSANGASQDGYILTWVNGSSEYQAKPAPVSFTAGGDLTGSNVSQQVINLTGTAGVVTTASSVTTLSFTTTAGFGAPQNITIKQSDNLSASPPGSFTVQAQSSGGGTNDGGTLILASGAKTGAALDGAIYLNTGSTNRFAINPSGVVQITNLGVGLVHADGSGNLTSSLLVDADVHTSAAISYSKLALGNSIVNADISSSAAIDVDKLAPGSAAQILLTSSGPDATWTTVSGDIAIDASGVVAVEKLQGNAVENASLGAPEDSYVLTWVNGSGEWQAQPAPGTPVTWADDLAGSTISSQTVAALQGNTLNLGTLGAGEDTYVLTWDNGAGELVMAPATGGGGGITTVGTIDSQAKSANGLVISGANIYAQTADATNPGLVSTGTQTFAGNKTLSGSTTLSALSTGVVHSGSGGALTSSNIVNADVDAAAAIAYSKLNLSASIVNADVASGAAIAYNKLNLATSIVNADINASAAIAGTKISPDFGSQIIQTTGSFGTTTTKSTYAGGQVVTTFTCSSSLTLGDGYYQVFVDTSAARSITLPAPANGREFWITDVIGTANTNNITLVRNGSEKINGVTASKILQTNWGSWRVISNGTDWFVM